VRVEGHLVQAMAAVIDEVVDLMLVDGVVGALGRRQLVRRNGVQATLDFGPIGQAALLGGGADVRQIGRFGGARRNLIPAPGVFLVGDSAELGVKGAGGRRRGRGGRRGRCSRRRRRQGGERQNARRGGDGAICGQGLHQFLPFVVRTPPRGPQREKPPVAGRLSLVADQKRALTPM